MRGEMRKRERKLLVPQVLLSLASSAVTNPLAFSLETGRLRNTGVRCILARTWWLVETLPVFLAIVLQLALKASVAGFMTEMTELSLYLELI